eukprot:15335507-Ditylum_brightwellii.AAC.1
MSQRKNVVNHRSAYKHMSSVSLLCAMNRVNGGKVEAIALKSLWIQTIASEKMKLCHWRSGTIKLIGKIVQQGNR